MSSPASSSAASTKPARGRTVCAALGVLCLLAALGLAAWNVLTERRAQTAAASALRVLEPQLAPAAPQTPGTSAAPEPEATAVPDYILDPGRAMPVVVVDGVAYIGVLDLPTLGITLPVTGEWSYDRLKIAACRYSGSAYLDNLVVMAHNYPAFFKNLGDLSPGDAVRFTDADGNVFDYEVSDFEQLRAAQTGAMTTGDWSLTLFTCTPGGRLRLAVRCARTP